MLVESLLGSGVSDPAVLAHARIEQRAVLTLNRRDFFRLHREQPDHEGITGDGRRVRYGARMPSQRALDAFVAMVLSNQHDEAIATFYTPDCTMQENLEPPRKGRDTNVARERKVMARATAIHSALEGPVFVSGDHVVIRWIFRFDFADGTRVTMDELAYQRWEGDLIAEERFYYDPAQRTPSTASA